MTLTNERVIKSSIINFKMYNTNFAQRFKATYYIVLQRYSPTSSPNYDPAPIPSGTNLLETVSSFLNTATSTSFSGFKYIATSNLTIINEYDEIIPSPLGCFTMVVEAKNIKTRTSLPNDRIIKKYEGKKIENNVFTYVIRCDVDMPLRIAATELPTPASQANILSIALSELNNKKRGYDTILFYNATTTRSSTVGIKTANIRKGGAILFYLPILEYVLSASCFLARSPVTLVDGSTKAIDDIQVGDVVRGAFGEHNTVIALKQGTLGDGKMCKINDEHVTTLNHPHITSDKKFVSCKGVLTDRHSEIIDAVSDEAYYALFELKRGRIQPLQIGTQLQTVDGPANVRTIEPLDLPPSTAIYNLSVSGSHTYFVNGYAVTGDMKESDFDVDTWSSRPQSPPS